MEQYKDYTARLATYGDKWPKNTPIAVEDLAKAGLFYTGQSKVHNGVEYNDIVQCPWCRNMLYNWQSGDSGFGEHMRHFPSCPFIVSKMQEQYEKYNQELLKHHKARTIYKALQHEKQTELEYLKRENERLKSTITCKVCLDARVGQLYLPCRHLVCCVQCTQFLDKCPVCRENIVGTIKAFI